jgi:hypothetical protein
MIKQTFDTFYRIFCSRELLLQGWMKPGRDDLAPNVALVSKRFNEVPKKNLIKVFFLLIHFFLDVSTCDYRNLITTNC